MEDNQQLKTDLDEYMKMGPPQFLVVYGDGELQRKYHDASDSLSAKNGIARVGRTQPV